MTALDQRQHLWVLFVALLVLFAAWAGTVAHIATIVWTVDTFSHGIWVPVVSGWLIRQRWPAMNQEPYRVWPPAILGLLACCLLWLVGQALEAAIFQHAALITAMQCLVVGVLGKAAYRAILFPMLFLYLLIPFGEELVTPLQVLTAKLVIWALDLSGVAFEADGVLIQLESGLFRVAAACAGVKFFLSSAVLGVLLAHLAFQSWRRRLLMIVAALAVPILANALRVYTTLLIAEMTDASFAADVDHIVYGWGFLSMVMIILIAVAYRFADKPVEEIVNRELSQSQSAQRYGSGYLGGIGLFFLLPAMALMLKGPAPQGAYQCQMTEIALPSCAECDVRLLGEPLVRHWFQPLGADQGQRWLYRIHGSRIEGMTNLYAPDRPGHRTALRFASMLADGWLVHRGNKTEPQTVGGATFAEYVVWRGETRRLVWFAYGVNDHLFRQPMAAKVHLALQRLQQRPVVGHTFMVATEMSSSMEDARDVLRTFLSTFPADRFLWSQDMMGGDNTICAA